MSDPSHWLDDNLSHETVVPAHSFDALLDELDREPETVPALVRAAARREARAAQLARSELRPSGAGGTA
jgi:hypothetical protein